MDKELAEAVKLFISQPLNNHLTRGQIMEVARTALPILEQQERGCQKCGGTGMADSGGTQPWGEQILVECDCQFEQQERGECWIEWRGDIDGLPPVGGDVIVEVEWSDGTVDSGVARHWRWSHENEDENIIPNIIAYRIIPEQPNNQNGEQ